MAQHLHKEEISKHMAESGLTPSDPGWLQKFQWCVNEVIGSLGEDDMQKYAEMAKSWNETEPPEEIQRK